MGLVPNGRKIEIKCFAKRKFRVAEIGGHNLAMWGPHDRKCLAIELPSDTASGNGCNPRRQL